ncbi:hypothetical protein CL634_05780 [bacterium]|nr:hypothetical protein [bacterium]
MGVKRYTAISDNTVTNAYEANLTTRGTGSNMGLADSLEIFSIYAQATTSSYEISRILAKFPVVTADATTTIQSERTDGTIPASGSVDFYLLFYNVKHTATLPKNFTLVVSPVSQSWEEGSGLDMEEYSALTYDGTGSNWINAAAHTAWVTGTTPAVTVEGGSYLRPSWNGASGSSTGIRTYPTTYDEFNYTQTFGEKGTGDLEVKITGLVEQWILGTGQNNPAGNPGFSNYGIGLMLSQSQESGSQSYYTKKFSARGSEYFLSRPVIEARWDNSKKDHRGSFVLSSSALDGADNLNTIYLYNYVRGQAKDLPFVDADKGLSVAIFTSASGGDQIDTVANSGTITYLGGYVTGGWVETGVYSASFALDTTYDVVFDRWFSGSTYGDAIDGSSTRIFHTGSFNPSGFSGSNIYSIPRYVTTITNLQSEYYNNDSARFRLFTRLKDWSPTIYTVASKAIENNIVEDAYFKIFRMIDDKSVISYGTGSLNHTRLSYDVTGSYFDLDMGMLETGYAYGIKFVYYINGAYQEQPEVFKFRVVE